MRKQPEKGEEPAAVLAGGLREPAVLLAAASANGAAGMYFEESTLGLLGWALVFLAVAGVAAVFGFGGMATAAAGIAKLVFFVFLAIFVVLIIAGMLGVSTATA